ncbi:hypothetical protein AB0O04_35255, partial [Streptomyces althioticus]|uniref:hypothetical protein n=1 Tax=Streptomyces althioticus TaxID=83380 RepID=UPI00341627AE
RGTARPAPDDPDSRPKPISPPPVDFATCPREQRRRPHAIGSDGAARCFQCGHTTSGRTR